MRSLLLRPRALVQFLRDPAAPKLPKLALLLAALYVVLPVDAVPDVIPFVGWLDDAGVLALVYGWLVSAIDRHEAARAAPEQG